MSSKSSINICHIIFSLANGGKENMLIDIMNEQSIAGHNLSLIIINDKVSVDVLSRLETSVKVFAFKRKPTNIMPIFLFRLLKTIAFKINPDIIHSHDPYLARIFKYLPKPRRFVTIHGMNAPIKQIRNYHEIIAVSNSVKFDIETRSDLKCTIIYNGIKFDDVRERNMRSFTNIFKIINVSNLRIDIKGQDILIKAVNYLVKQEEMKDIYLDLIGDGESRSKLEKMILELKLNNIVHLMGLKSREWVYKNIANYDLFVLSSRSEAFGLSLVEAVAAKLPVIASNIEGPSEILEEGRYGKLYEQNNYYELAERIKEVREAYLKNIINAKINMAYNHFKKKYEVSNTALSYINAYMKEL